MIVDYSPVQTLGEHTHIRVSSSLGQPHHHVLQVAASRETGHPVMQEAENSTPG
ncbi:hypothetical protein SK128_024160, partial [Halocaridina rubra]